MHGSELIFCFFPDRTEWVGFHKIPDFSCSCCVKRMFYSAFVWKCTHMCKHRFGVQLLENPSLCRSTPPPHNWGFKVARFWHRFHSKLTKKKVQKTSLCKLKVKNLFFFVRFKRPPPGGFTSQLWWTHNREKKTTYLNFSPLFFLNLRFVIKKKQ